ncbi:HWE histidine kinase domain-containing protein [Roseomonas sp. AR75]|uniref:HWE histidine kinase domain-containing protein n=1 Tax=Roseomonas sp. AR75 TaxID=2562311 RepID=UPI0010C12F40|nr:HWE histidine kinase domain-containing protein [Roseomonas sp. AR75]
MSLETSFRIKAVAAPAPTGTESGGEPRAPEPGAPPPAIQPHGLLLVLHPGRLEVLQRAGDPALLGAAPRPGMKLADLLPPAALAEVMQLLAQPPEAELHAAAIALPDGTRLDVSARHGEAGVLLEFERPPAPPREEAALPAVAAMAARLEAAPDVASLCQAAVEALRGFTGFDSVALHRLAPEGGSVLVARAGCLPGAEPHDPALQAPHRARETELQGWSRLVPDAAGTPAPLDPPLSPLTGAPTDLALARLRAASPAQLADLLRAGVRAAMTLPVLREGRLWGVFACHAAAPRHLPLATRAGCELFAQLVSLQIEAASQAAEAGEAARLVAAEAALLAALAAAPSLEEGLRAQRAPLRAFLPDAAIAVLAGDAALTDGAAPPAATLHALHRALAGAAGVVALDEIADSCPETAERGIGVLRLALPEDRAILWFRRGAAGPLPAHRWSPLELEAAEALRVALLESVLHRMEEVAQERARARQRQDARLNELDHRVKAMLARIHALAAPDGAGVLGLEALLGGLHARLRGQAQAQGLLAFGRWEGASLRGLAEEQLRPLPVAAPRIAIDGPELRLRARAALALALALQELASNAARHGALRGDAGQVHLSWQVAGDRLRLDWAEQGGPPVAPPARRGFGSLVIERGLAGELGGESRLDFDPAGLRWRAILPLATLAAPGAAPTPPPRATELKGARVLVVEDSAFVAMEMADGLEAAGAEVLGPVARMEEAEAAIAASLPDAALLDIDIDGVPVFPIADRLTEQGVPIVFTTGYEPRLVLPPRYARAAVLPKPCRGDEAAAAVRLALAER